MPGKHCSGHLPPRTVSIEGGPLQAQPYAFWAPVPWTLPDTPPQASLGGLLPPQSRKSPPEVKDLTLNRVTKAQMAQWHLPE